MSRDSVRGVAHRVVLPFVICGERVEGNAEVECRLPGGEVHLPRLTDEMVDRILTSSRHTLRDVPLHEIVSFLHNVGHNWKSSEYPRRRLYVRYLTRQFGYSQKMAETEANWIALLLSSHYRLYDGLATELGSWHVMDDWVAREEAHVRAFPRGRVFHVAPGNVPLSSVVSVLRALMTKNVSVVKAASDDPMTPIALALSFLDVDAEHPVTKAMSVVHWHGAKAGTRELRLLKDADVVCAWGGQEAVAWASENASPMAEVIKFGPRRSIAVVGRTNDYRAAARALAHDVCMYDQRACFSVQRVFVEEPIDDFLAELEPAFRTYEKILPKGLHDFDERAGWSLTELRARFSGATVKRSEDQQWSIVIGAATDIDDHPLGRTVFVHPIARAEDVTAYVGPEVQTVAVFPGELGLRLRDACGSQGISRVVELGLNNVFRVGTTHDGMYPLQRLVRFVSTEFPSKIPLKGMVVPLNQTTFLEENRFVEFIP